MKNKIILFLTLTLITIIFSLTALSQKSAPLPDFTITSEDINVELSGEDLTITATVTNEGSAYEKFIDVLILVGNISFDERIKGLKAKEKKQIKVGPIAIGEEIPEDLKVKVSIDPDNEIVESNEKNNVAEKEIGKVAREPEIKLPDKEVGIMRITTADITTTQTTSDECYNNCGEIGYFPHDDKQKKKAQEIANAIKESYKRNGGKGKLGCPKSCVHRWNETDAKFAFIQDFEKVEGGIIVYVKDGDVINYDKKDKAYLVKKEFMLKYLDLGGPKEIGTPISDESEYHNRKGYESKTTGTFGKYQKFYNYKDIMCSYWGCYLVKGKIQKKYADMGYANSQLGWPTSDYIENLKTQTFEGGRIVVDKNGNAEIKTKPPFPTKVLYANLHSHTQYSDSYPSGSGERDESLNPKNVLWRVDDRNNKNEINMKIMAITDHGGHLDKDEWQWTEEQVADANKKLSIVALRGFEWTGGRHVCIFGTRNFMDADFFYRGPKEGNLGTDPHPGNPPQIIKDMWPEKCTQVPCSLSWWLVNNITSSSAFNYGYIMAQFNHPLENQDKSYFKPPSFELNKIFNLMEVRSCMLIPGETGLCKGGVGDGKNSDTSSEYWYRLALKNGWHVSPTINEDNHSGEYGTGNGKTGIWVENDIFNVDKQLATIQSLRRRWTFATEDKKTSIEFWAEYYKDKGKYPKGTKIFMGTKVPYGDRDKIKLKFRICRDEYDNTNNWLKDVKIIENRNDETEFYKEHSINWKTESDSPCDTNIDKDEKTLEDLKIDSKTISCYIKGVQDDNNAIISAPIWIKK